MNRFVYAIAAGGCIKIGISKDPVARLANLQTGLPCRAELIGSIPGNLRDESDLHYALAEYRVRGEWFADCAFVRAHIAAFSSGHSGSMGHRELPLRALEIAPNKDGFVAKLCRTNLVNLANIFMSVRSLGPSTLGRACIRDGYFFQRIAAGSGFLLRTYDEVVRWFADNWPDGAEWPSDLPRPAPTVEVAE